MYLSIIREFLLVLDLTYHFLYITYFTHPFFFSFSSPLSPHFFNSFYVYIDIYGVYFEKRIFPLPFSIKKLPFPPLPGPSPPRALPNSLLSFCTYFTYF